MHDAVFFQPALKVLHANRVLDLGLLYFNRDRCPTMADILYPFIVAESPQSLSDRFLDAAGTNFNRMFNFLKVETGNCACLQSHKHDLSYSLFLHQVPPFKAPPVFDKVVDFSR